MSKSCPHCGGHETPDGSEWIPYEDNGAAHTSHFCSKECLGAFKRALR